MTLKNLLRTSKSSARRCHHAAWIAPRSAAPPSDAGGWQRISVARLELVAVYRLSEDGVRPDGRPVRACI